MAIDGQLAGNPEGPALEISALALESNCPVAGTPESLLPQILCRGTLAGDPECRT
jgi:hypothetical protein